MRAGHLLWIGDNRTDIEEPEIVTWLSQQPVVALLLSNDRFLMRKNVVEAEDHAENEVTEQKEDVEEERPIVAAPDTVIDPRAVVVKGVNTAVAKVAVATVPRKDSFAAGAQAVWVAFIDQLLELDSFLLLDRASVHI